MAEQLRDLGLVYRKLLGAKIRSDWQYRTSFVLNLASQALIAFLDFLAIVFIFSRVPALAGWSIAEVAFLYGTAGIAFNLADVFVSQVEVASRRIKDGSFDVLLIRPLGALFQLSAEEFAFRRFGKLAQAGVVLVVALTQVDVAWTAGRIAMLPVMIVAGTVIFSAVWVITASMAFWTVETQEVANSATYGGNYLTQYPLELFGPWLRRLLAFAVPLAFVSYFPALYVLDKADPLGTPSVVRFLSPAVAVAAALLARAVWHAAIREYRSTGS